MYNLRRFILKHHFVILFIILEVISVLLLARSQRFHRNSLVSSTNEVIGTIYKWGSDVGGYFHLGKTNEQLAEENALLRKQLSVIIDTAALAYTTVERDTVYEYIPARVVNNSINQANNFILINKGWVDGIERDMGVVSPEGIVGVVTDVSKHYASVLSLLHSKSFVGVRFKNSQQLASLRWNTNNYRYGMVEDIPTHVELHKGDTVLTSSYSFIFPEDMMVGTVEDPLAVSSDALNKAKIRFATDFATLRHVYVIKNLYKAELDSLRANFNKQ
ncbi:MAG: rod shape-determining protein MreC [Bacteroidales bacterium]|nr:rod shape-determining protein MreC [Bacteroidales bacterium]